MVSGPHAMAHPRRYQWCTGWRSGTAAIDQWRAVAEGSQPGSAGHIYSRNTDPTVAVLEEKRRLLEGAAAATSCATGMAAMSSTRCCAPDIGWWR